MEAGTTNTRSENELRQAIDGFSDVQWLRLRRVARAVSRGGRLTPDDLIQEAIIRSLTPKTAHEGRRCPIDVDVVKFLAEAIRSVADGEWEKAQIREAVPLMAPGEVLPGQVDPPDESDGPAALLERREEYNLRRTALLSLFDDDTVARDLLEGEIEGMSKRELLEMTGLDETAYDTKRRLMRRRINQRYPDGFAL